jgi:hypothetical protein
VKSGYTVTVAQEATGAAVAGVACNGAAALTTSYWASANPVTIGSTGQRAFATDTRGTIFQDPTGAPLANPIPVGTAPVQ